jgi:hypothetical protein
VAGPSNDREYSRGPQDLELAVKPAMDEHITGKQGQPELLGPVPPAMGDGIEGEKHFMTFIRKNPGDGLLVLVPRIECMPMTPRARILNFRSLVSIKSLSNA